MLKHCKCQHCKDTAEQKVFPDFLLLIIKRLRRILKIFQKKFKINRLPFSLFRINGKHTIQKQQL
jgi:hypothetical protein